MIDYKELIEKYCAENTELQHILLTHSRQVADRALSILQAHPEWVESGEVNPVFIEEVKTNLEATFDSSVRSRVLVPVFAYPAFSLRRLYFFSLSHHFH